MFTFLLQAVFITLALSGSLVLILNIIAIVINMKLEFRPKEHLFFVACLLVAVLAIKGIILVHHST